MGDDFVRGVGVDLERGAQGAHGRERVTRTQLTGYQGLLSGIYDLFVQRTSRPKRHPEGYHGCIITRSTVSVNTFLRAGGSGYRGRGRSTRRAARTISEIGRR